MSTTTPSGPDEAAKRPTPPPGPALDVATALAEHLEQVSFPLDIPGAEHARDLRRRILAQITSHLLPRLRQVAMPTIVVVGGPTGAGKSTLVNTLAGSEVSLAGVLRPTTRRPVLVVNPADLEHVAEHPVASRAEVVTADGIPAGVALLDAPDLDSVDEENRRLAVELVETADMWLFVTTANRYGDALPWTILDVVRRRGVSIGIVLDRVADDVVDIVRRDLLQRLVDSGFGSVPLFIVPDAGPLDGRLPESHVADVARWLELLATRAASRGVTARTVRGVWKPLRTEVRELLEAVSAQLAASDELAASARSAVESVTNDLVTSLEAGALADGGPTTRWLALAGAGGPLAPVAHDVGGFFARRRLPKQAPARRAALEALVAEVARSFEDVVGRAGAEAEGAVRRQWSQTSEAGAGLAAGRSAATAAAERGGRVTDAWATWLVDVAALVPAEPTPVDAGSEPLLDRDGRVALLLLAAAGIEGAAGAARRWWPDADALVTSARTTLGALARAATTSEVTGFTAAIESRLDPGAVTALRLRVGELRVLAGED